jgi:PAS domain-containing protein
LPNDHNRGAAVKASSVVLFPQPALQSIYDTAPIGLAFLSPDCRYLQINQRLTEICGISVEDHLGRSVRDCVRLDHEDRRTGDRHRGRGSARRSG